MRISKLADEVHYIDFDRGYICGDSDPIEITSETHLRILEYLADNAGIRISSKTLLENCWQEREAGYSETTVYTTIFQMKRKYPVLQSSIPNGTRSGFLYKGSLTSEVDHALVSSWERKHHESVTLLQKRETIELAVPIQTRLSGRVKSISLCAAAGIGLFHHYRYLVENALRDNPDCSVRVISLEPGCAAALEVERHILEGNVRARSRIIPNSYQDLLDWQDEYRGRFEFRTTNWFLPFALFFVERGNVAEDSVKVDFYSFGTNDAERRCSYITGDDSDNYNFFVNQFETIWDAAKKTK